MATKPGSSSRVGRFLLSGLVYATFSGMYALMLCYGPFCLLGLIIGANCLMWRRKAWDWGLFISAFLPVWLWFGCKFIDWSAY